MNIDARHMERQKILGDVRDFGAQFQKSGLRKTDENHGFSVIR